MPPSSPIAYRPEIDGLRAIAIASVVLFHAGSSWFPGGYVGVDVFFVISGYLITSIIVKEQAEGRFSYWRFYARRARRILPALFFMLTVVTALCFAILLPDGLIEYGKLLIYTVIFGANFRLAAEPGYFDAGSQENPLLHMWSLSVEEQFYLIWPALLVATLLWLSMKRVRQTVCVLALASLICSAVLVDYWPKSAFYHLPSRGWELLCGAILAVGILPEIKSKVLAQGLSALGLTLITAPVFLYDKETVFPGLAALPPAVGCALVIYSNATFKTATGAFLSLRPFVYAGLISYSLYLWHWPLLALPSYIVMTDLTLAQRAGCVVTAIVMAGLSYRLVERPFRGRKRDIGADPGTNKMAFRINSIPVLGYAGVAVAAALIVSGSFFQKSRGAQWRFPPESLAIAAAGPNSDYLSCTQPARIENDITSCQMGNDRTENQKHDVILWGDSHAMHYERLIAAVYNRGIAYIHDGCVPILNVYLVYSRIGLRDKACFYVKGTVFANIIKARPKIVVLAGRWTYSESFPYGRELHTTPFFIRKEGDVADSYHSRIVFEEELRHTVTALSSAGIKVVLMGQAPEMLTPVSHCLSLSRYFIATKRSVYRSLARKSSGAKLTSTASLRPSRPAIRTSRCFGRSLPCVTRNDATPFAMGRYCTGTTIT